MTSDSIECDKQLPMHSIRASLLADGGSDWYRDQEGDPSMAGLNTLISSLHI